MPDSEVRRAALLNVPPTKQTLPALLARGRDVDITTRKLVYSAVLEPHCVSEDGDAEIGITHPRALTIAQRELVVQNGLGDREGGVRAAAGKLIGTWVDVVRVSMPKTEGEEIAAGTEGDVIALLSLFDLAENTVAEDALLSVFVTRPDILDSVEFGGTSLFNRSMMAVFTRRYRQVLGVTHAGEGIFRSCICGSLHKYQRRRAFRGGAACGDRTCVSHSGYVQ